MIRTLIADDDFLVRTYLKSMKAWSKAGFEIIGDTRDGEETLQALDQLQPELLVTDVSMPLMNGIDLIREIRSRNRSLYIIVLSCHDDFEYVKEAMRLGADEYVLKNSLNEDSLYEMLGKTAKALSARKEKYQEADKSQSLIEEGLQLRKSGYFSALLFGDYSLEELEAKRMNARIFRRYDTTGVILMSIPDWPKLRYEFSPEALSEKARQFLAHLMYRLQDRQESQKAECVYMGDGIFACFVDLSHLLKQSLMQQSLTRLAAICFSASQEQGYAIETSVSSICFGPDSIKEAYNQARAMSKLAFYIHNKILYYDENHPCTRSLPPVARQFSENVKNLVLHQDREEFDQAYQAVMAAFELETTEPDQVRLWLKDLDEQLSIERSSADYASLVRLEDLSGLLEGMNIHCFELRGLELAEEISPVIRQVVAYIRAHFKEPIGLSDAAEEAGLNAAYLSYLFKKEMGTGFAAYVLEMRIDFAKGLLMRTNLKIKEVVERSGFNDYHYFSKTFKKMTGQSPAAYRKMTQSSSKTTEI